MTQSICSQAYPGSFHIGNVKHNLLAQYLDRADAKPFNITVFSHSSLEQAGSYLKGSLRTILRSEVSTGASWNVSRQGGKTEPGPGNKSACPDCYQIPYTRFLTYKIVKKFFFIKQSTSLESR